MREHALPQDVTGYKFHIIGNMTLKQFVEVAAGFVVGFFIYQTNLANFIKWPLMALFAGLGAMIAFVPIEERPLDQWVMAFFRALYRPTQYYWKRVPKIPEPFLFEPKSTTTSLVGEVDLNPARRQRVKEYLRSIDTPNSPDTLENYGNQRLTEVMDVFKSELTPAFMQVEPKLDVNQSTPETVETVMENLSFVGRASGEEVSVSDQSLPSVEAQSESVLHLFDNVENEVTEYQPETISPSSSFVSTPTEAIMTTESPSIQAINVSDITDDSRAETPSQPETTALPPISSVFDALPTQETVPKVNLSADQPLTSATVNQTQVSGDQVQYHLVANGGTKLTAAQKRKFGPSKVEFKTKRDLNPDHSDQLIPHIIDVHDTTPLHVDAEPAPQPETSTQESREVVVPDVQEVRVAKTVVSKEPDVLVASINQNSDQTSTAVDPSLLEKQEELQNVSKDMAMATQNPDLPFPIKPTTPNKVVGMVLDKAGQPMPNAIVEILTETGLPARAVKTNPLGQFFITTPLNVGEYMIRAEQDGYEFPTRQLVINDQILEPFEIRAT